MAGPMAGEVYEHYTEGLCVVLATSVWVEDRARPPAITYRMIASGECQTRSIKGWNAPVPMGGGLNQVRFKKVGK